MNKKINEEEYQKILFPVKTKQGGVIYTILLKCIKNKGG